MGLFGKLFGGGDKSGTAEKMAAASGPFETSMNFDL